MAADRQLQELYGAAMNDLQTSRKLAVNLFDKTPDLALASDEVGDILRRYDVLARMLQQYAENGIGLAPLE